MQIDDIEFANRGNLAKPPAVQVNPKRVLVILQVRLFCFACSERSVKQFTTTFRHEPFGGPLRDFFSAYRCFILYERHFVPATDKSPHADVNTFRRPSTER